MFALIFQNKVIELTDNSFDVSPEMQWVSVSDTDLADFVIGRSYVNGAIVIPQTDNEEIRQNILSNLRLNRLGKFIELDVASLRALEDGDIKKLAEIKLIKQKLRDVTEELKNFVIEDIECPEIEKRLNDSYELLQSDLNV